MKNIHTLPSSFLSKFKKSSLSRLRMLVILAVSIGFFVFSTSSFMTYQNGNRVAMLSGVAFTKGEKISYLVHYGFINAGEAIVKVDNNSHNVNGNSCYRVDVEGKTVGVFAWTTDVDDKWSSYIDTQKHIPRKFYRKIKENKYRKEETVMFDHNGKQANVKYKKRNDKNWTKKEYPIPTNVQDMISGYYFLRRVDYEKLTKNEIIRMDAFFEDSVYDFKVRYIGKETIKTKLGKKETFVMTPIMPENGIFSGKESIKIWMSADEDRIPLKIRADMFIGGVEVDITEYEK
ncbi:MAG: DUF3108 domain-containing protein [Flexibacter sp. CG_4_10_14_3_um_filter_32_15]|nr:MAG: DUF3108 domain-containing protein [Flexibacter sp. CG_4_10_14_3_um_filter_32_15]